MLLRPYLVSKRNKTAGEILQSTCNVRRKTGDAELSSFLPVAREKAEIETMLCIDVAVIPPLADVLESDTRLGQMTMSVHHQDGKKYQMTLPLNKAFLVQTLPEYAAWCVLKTLTRQNG